MTASLWQHLRFIEAHSEFSFLVRSNHYLSNIVGLTTLSAYLRGPGMQRRFGKYARAVSTGDFASDLSGWRRLRGFHRLSRSCGTDVSAFVWWCSDACRGVIAPEFEARLRLMFEWIALLADDDGKLPHLGDCDNGRVELLGDDIAQTGSRPAKGTPCASGPSAGWHLICSRCPLAEVRTSRAALLPDSGIAVAPLGRSVGRLLRDAEWTSGEREVIPIAISYRLFFALARTRFSAIAAADATRVRQSCETWIAPPGRTIP